MQLITRTQLNNVKKSFESARGATAISDALKESRQRKALSSEVSIFLSHKHDDSEELKAAIALLKRVGVAVYVDWLDEEMPKTTSGETAARLKKKIAENKKFILLATERAINSKWCNWELGLGDAARYINDIALLVVKDDNNNWTGTEYLQIYPVIGRKWSVSDDYYEVQFPNGTTTDLHAWLTSP